MTVSIRKFRIVVLVSNIRTSLVWLNSSVLRQRLNAVSDRTALSEQGRTLQAWVAATGNSRSQSVVQRVDETTRALQAWIAATGNSRSQSVVLLVNKEEHFRRG